VRFMLAFFMYLPEWLVATTTHRETVHMSRALVKHDQIAIRIVPIQRVQASPPSRLSHPRQSHQRRRHKWHRARPTRHACRRVPMAARRAAGGGDRRRRHSGARETNSGVTVSTAPQRLGAPRSGAGRRAELTCHLKRLRCGVGGPRVSRSVQAASPHRSP
jgi:hypothetical protein